MVTKKDKREEERKAKVAGFSVVVEVPSPTGPSTYTLLLPIGVGYELYGLPHPTVGQTLYFFLSCSRSSVGQTCSELLPLATETGHSHQLSSTNSTVFYLFVSIFVWKRVESKLPWQFTASVWHWNCVDFPGVDWSTCSFFLFLKKKIIKLVAKKVDPSFDVGSTYLKEWPCRTRAVYL